MANINDYIQRYSSASMLDMEFNQIDGLILAELAYIKWDDIIPGVGEEGKKTLKTAISDLRMYKADYYNSLSDNFKQMLTTLEQSDRFSDLVLSNYQSIFDQELVEQFAAITFSFNTLGHDLEQHFMSFRGTDNTLTGWNEDFMMAYDPDTRAQKASVHYMNTVGALVTGDLRSGGHSKGGNNSNFGYMYRSEDIRKRFVALYSYDGPGFLPEVTRNSNYRLMSDLLGKNGVAPYNSIIGLILDENVFTFVDTDAGLLLDHDGFSWKIDLDHAKFIEREQSKLSQFLNKTLDKWVFNLSVMDRKLVVDAVWDYINMGNFKNFSEVLEYFNEDKTRKLFNLILYFASLDSTTKNALINAISTLLFIIGFYYVDGKIEDVNNWTKNTRKTIFTLIDSVGQTTLIWPYVMEKEMKEFYNRITYTTTNLVNDTITMKIL